MGQIGIVGMPNVGKSTLFNTLTKCSIPAENFPFCTIEPNEARVNIPDERFTWLCNQYHPKSKVPAFLEIVDIAGLVKGAADGAGLGNAFLSNIMVRPPSPPLAPSLLRDRLPSHSPALANVRPGRGRHLPRVPRV